MEAPRWTLDELAERVDAALAVGYHGQPSGRVRDVPDRRAIRWYTTIGLIDRPVAHRGRTALYGPRHLLQLVAVKRLQAKGLPLVAIQQELAGATDTELQRVARLPADAAVARPARSARPAGSAGSGARAVPDTGNGPPAATVPPRPTGGPGVAAPGMAARRVAAAPARRAAFWRDSPVAALTTETTAASAPAGREDPALPGAAVVTLRGVRLAGGATLLLEPGRELDAADLHAILAAARPLLAVLRDRRLAGDGEPRREHP